MSPPHVLYASAAAGRGSGPTTELVVQQQQQQQQQELTTNNNNNRQTYMARLILRMQDCLRQLGVDTESDFLCRKMEAMSILIHESMSISSRNYHSVQHVFDISRDLTDPIAILAALFHDCVYYNVDGGLSKRQAERLKGVFCHPDCYEDDGSSGGCVLEEEETTSSDDDGDPLRLMVVSIFGYEPGQRVTPMTGLNEFLSAVIAVRELEPLLSTPILAQIACCIEATIPFRPTDKETGETAMDRLYKHMIETNQRFELQMNDDELVRAVQRAVLLANSDVGNFGTTDRGWFLDNTWSLLPESNAALRHQFLYTVREFQFAVFKMNGFFSFLKADVIFQQFRGVPSDEELSRMTANAARNIEIGRKYVGAKLLSVSVLAAFSELTGGDAPISMFMGDLPSRNRISIRLEDNLPTLPPSDVMKHCDQEVYDLLSSGRKSESTFDTKESPLAAYLYGTIGDQGLEQILNGDVHQLYPMNNEDTAYALLQRLPRCAVEKVADNVARVARSRSELIHRVVESLDSQQQKS